MVAPMARGNKQKDLLTRLSDAGEEALTRVAGSQTTTRVMDTVGGMRERLDDMQKKIRGLDELEKRVAKLEKKIDDLSKPKRKTASRSRSTTSRRATTRPATRKKPPSQGTQP
jgi:phage shock protein A